MNTIIKLKILSLEKCINTSSMITGGIMINYNSQSKLCNVRRSVFKNLK